MKRVLQTLAVLALSGLVGAIAVVGLGLYNVSAQKGHWPGVSWVLHTTYHNSVKLRAGPADEVPDLSDPAMIELGARHYETACAVCHATPGAGRTATMQSMVPAPPHIEEAVSEWEANHLHWIVFNGIKMSGMPAWPADRRKEEVWPVVAYLMAIKTGLSPERQAALTARPEVEGPAFAGYCSGCHEGIDGQVPRLEIQTEAYLAEALTAYRRGTRPSGIMQQAATLVPDSALAPLAAHYSRQTPSGAAGPATEATARGAELARRGTDDVPACTACHGPDATRAEKDFPSLAGQDAAYLAAQLHLWREEHRGGSELMRKAAQDLSDADIDVLAAYYAALAPAKRDVADR